MTMQSINEDKRGTGRTTRMLQEAKRLLDVDQPVTIVFLRGTVEARELRPVGIGGMAARIVLGVPAGFNWDRMKPKGCTANEVWLVDHAAVEASGATGDSAVRAMTKYDVEAGAST